MSKSDIEFVLTHDGKNWICKNDLFTIQGEDFAELDEAISQQLRQSGKFAAGEVVDIAMNFDFDTIPRWLRQYHSHYFNRLVTLNL